MLPLDSPITFFSQPNHWPITDTNYGSRQSIISALILNLRKMVIFQFVSYRNLYIDLSRLTERPKLLLCSERQSQKILVTSSWESLKLPLRLPAWSPRARIECTWTASPLCWMLQIKTMKLEKSRRVNKLLVYHRIYYLIIFKLQLLLCIPELVALFMCKVEIVCLNFYLHFPGQFLWYKLALFCICSNPKQRYNLLIEVSF